MVKVAVAGGTGTLECYDVCLSFIVVHLDNGNIAQKNLIHACIDAGVKRFAPSEWALARNSGIPIYEGKDVIADYLHELNREKTVLEYSLFQPSIFLDYLAHPYPLSGLNTSPFFIDLESRRALKLDDGNQPIVVTAIDDDSEIVARALDDPRPWPAAGGIRGQRTTFNELIALVQKVRGGEWHIESVESEDTEKGQLNAKWIPPLTHPNIPVEMREHFSRQFVLTFFRSLSKGSWDVGKEWNERFPDYKFVGLEEYITKAWEGKQ